MYGCLGSPSLPAPNARILWFLLGRPARIGVGRFEGAMVAIAKRADGKASAKASRSGAIPFSWGMVLVTLGVVYGDIGTSPM